MTIQAVVGINWGDEGKGRMIDYLAQKADAVVRYQGGNNAGHTVVNDLGEFKLHLIPSGIFNKKTLNILGPGMVINLEALCAEIAELEQAGIDVASLRISDRATICFPYHQWEDMWEEERLGKAAYGSTRQGIAPAYGDRYIKKTILVGELLDTENLKNRLNHILQWKNVVAEGVYGKKDAINLEEMLAWAEKWGNKLKPYICDTTTLLEDMAAKEKNILFEAQLGALRDIYYGIYPMTTSSPTIASYAPVGGGLFNYHVGATLGVMKAFSTCVGAGPFVTELHGEEAETRRKKANEYGATTGRPRRIGYFDAVASRYGCMVQGATSIAITKLDSLSGWGNLKICTHYEINGKKLDTFPLNHLQEQASPVYIEMPGWDEDISRCRSFDELPEAAQNYVLKIEELVRCPIEYISVGPEREALIKRDLTKRAQAS